MTDEGTNWGKVAAVAVAVLLLMGACTAFMQNTNNYYCEAGSEHRYANADELAGLRLIGWSCWRLR